MEYLRVDLRQMHPSALAAALAVGVAAAARAGSRFSPRTFSFFSVFAVRFLFFKKKLSSKSDRRIVS